MVLLLAAVPAAFVLVSALLALSWMLERLVLSPRSMILTTARSSRSDPEFAELFVAREVERLLDASQR
jgi:hypothetical protein